MNKTNFFRKLQFIMMMPIYVYICLSHNNIYEFLIAIILSSCLMKFSKGLTKVLRDLSNTDYSGITIHETEKKKTVWRYAAPMHVAGRNEKVETFFIVMTFIIYLRLLYECFTNIADFEFIIVLVEGYVVGAFIGNIELLLKNNNNK